MSGFRFTRRLRLFPGVRLNLSKRGVRSVSIGPRGADVTVSTSRQVAANVGFGGGMFWRWILRKGGK